ncbi:hypothetical protein, partial [uncultured Dubosiella sp.]
MNKGSIFKSSSFFLYSTVKNNDPPIPEKNGQKFHFGIAEALFSAGMFRRAGKNKQKASRRPAGKIIQ